MCSACLEYVIFSLVYHKDPIAGAGPLTSEWLFGDTDRTMRRISSDREPSKPNNDKHHSPCQSTQTKRKGRKVRECFAKEVTVQKHQEGL